MLNLHHRLATPTEDIVLNVDDEQYAAHTIPILFGVRLGPLRGDALQLRGMYYWVPPRCAAQG